METYREIPLRKDSRLTPVQEGIKRGLKSLYNTDELASSPRFEALMKRLQQKEDEITSSCRDC